MNFRPPLLDVRELTTDFPTDQGTVRAVDTVSFTVERGDTLGIAGETGAGKSALVRTIVDLVPASAQVTGDVLVDGRLLSALPKTEKRHLLGGRIGMVLQDPMTSLNPVRKIGHQLVDPMRYHLGLSRADARRRAVELLELVRMPQASQRLSQYPHELSGGMRQRVGIAIALSCDPELLIADEATTALDVTVQKEILDLLKALQQDLGMGLIIISHDLGVLATRTDRVLIMYAGRFVEDAPTAELFRAPRHPYTAALLAAIPVLSDEPHTRLAAIPGQPPDLVNQPPGCRFAPRCALAGDRCRTAEPPLEASDDHVGAPHSVGLGRRVRCFFPLSGPDAPARTEVATGQAGTVVGAPDRAKGT